MKFFVVVPTLNVTPNISLIILILLITTVTSGERDNKCPPVEDIPLCECRDEFNAVVVSCLNFLTPSDLIDTVHELSSFSIDGLEITHISLMYLPSGLFRSLPLHFLSFRNGEILGLEFQDGNVMFEGITDSLEQLRLNEIEGVNSWRWKALTSLRKLKIIDIRACKLEAITRDFTHISPKTLKEVNLMSNKIKYLDNNVFASFTALSVVDLGNNAIEELKRSMFPRPAVQLKFLYLSHNGIKHLPDDLFTDMPKLITVDVRYNNIQWLNSKPLLPVGGHIKNLKVSGNDIFCCSSMEELLRSKLHEIITGECNSPKLLKGRSIKELEINDLRHGYC